MKKAAAVKRSAVANSAVAEISVYGRQRGGFIVRFADGRMVGDGELRFDGLTGTVWSAASEIRKVSPVGVVLVHYDFPFGPKVASFRVEDVWPYWGDLRWSDAPVFVISVEDLLKAEAEQQAATFPGHPGHPVTCQRRCCRREGR